MSELRQDRTTGRWVIIAPQRGRRPHPDVAARRRAPPRPRFDPGCPFCPGHESELPGIVAEMPAPAAPGWQVRVVPNKFPALQEQPPAAAPAGHGVRAGYGFHEVVIESPRHDADLATLGADELRVVLAACRDRLRALFGRPGIEAAVLFRNRGPRAGASLAHPHAQIVALAMQPPRLAALGEWGRRHYAAHGRCATCDELEGELRLGTRVVEQNERFLSLVPFAAAHPCEVWVVPRRHQASFTALADDDVGAFGALLGSALRRIGSLLDEPPYNFVVESAARGDFGAPHVHWRLRIVPEVAVRGGFELGTGLPINPSTPEDDARALRGARAGP